MKRADRGMVFTVDLATCTGCHTCRIACLDRAGTFDDVKLLRIEEQETGAYPHPSLAYRVVHCFHCAAPPCAEVCPTQAITRDAEGWVEIDDDACNGCGACRDACPFGAIVLGTDDIAIKCDGCRDEVEMGWDPTCVRACPMRALGFVAAEEAVHPGRVRDPEFDERGIGPRIVNLRRK